MYCNISFLVVAVTVVQGTLAAPGSIKSRSADAEITKVNNLDGQYDISNDAPHSLAKRSAGSVNTLMKLLLAGTAGYIGWSYLRSKSEDDDTEEFERKMQEEQDKREEIKEQYIQGE